MELWLKCLNHEQNSVLCTICCLSSSYIRSTVLQLCAWVGFSSMLHRQLPIQWQNLLSPRPSPHQEKTTVKFRRFLSQELFFGGWHKKVNSVEDGILFQADYIDINFGQSPMFDLHKCAQLFVGWVTRNYYFIDCMSYGMHDDYNTCSGP